MKHLLAIVPGLSNLALLGQPSTLDEPTRQEIADAYRSKTGEGTFALGSRWERWRIQEVRGWALRFKRVTEKSAPGK